MPAGNVRALEPYEPYEPNELYELFEFFQPNILKAHQPLRVIRLAAF